MTSHQDAYLAGLIDGEGNLRSYKDRRFSRRICFTNTFRPTIDWVHQNYGGQVYEVQPPQPHHLLKWNVLWTSIESITRVLDAIEPYCQIKASIIAEMREDIASAPGHGRPGIKRKAICIRGHEIAHLAPGTPCPRCKKFWNDVAQARRVAARNLG